MSDLQGEVTFEEDPYEAVKDAHCIVLMTHWDEYRQLDYQHIFDSMAKPAFIFDGRNHLDHQQLFEIGFNVFPIGKPPLSHLD